MIYPVTIEGVPIDIESDYGVGDRVLICGDARRAATIVELAGLCPEGHPLWAMVPDARPNIELVAYEDRFIRRFSS